VWYRPCNCIIIVILLNALYARNLRMFFVSHSFMIYVFMSSFKWSFKFRPTFPVLYFRNFRRCRLCLTETKTLNAQFTTPDATQRNVVESGRAVWLKPCSQRTKLTKLNWIELQHWTELLALQPCNQSTSWRWHARPITCRVTGSNWCMSVQFSSVRLLWTRL